MSSPALEVATATAAEVLATAPPVVAATGRALTIATSGRALQVAIRAQLLRSVIKLWPALDKKRLDATWPGWLEAMSLLTNAYRAQSSAAAAATYRAAREHATESPAPRSLIKLAPDADPEWMARAYGFSGPGMLNRDTASPNTALSTTLGTASRIVLDGGRTTTANTVKSDPVAVGWYFKTDADPCFFCALIASRGVVFKDHSFAVSDVQFVGDGTAKVHDNCACVLAPAFSLSQELPSISAEALAVYKNRGKGKGNHDGLSQDALNKFRRDWEARNAPTS